MKFAIVFVAVLAVAVAAPLDSPQDAQILKFENDNIGVDGYKFAWVYLTSITKCNGQFK